ncbi:MAG TPA: TonB-dependent receptor, partial [Myxococcaceae bacterium]|nr:TonB-dependent receptor [Myxococcaceae bacterium]
GGEAMMFRSDISVRNAEQIEISYGPGSTLYGQDAISAVINISTKPEKEQSVEAALVSGYPFRTEGWAGGSARIGEALLTAQVHAVDADLTDSFSRFPEVWTSPDLAVGPDDAGLTFKRYDRGVNALVRLESGTGSLQAWFRQSLRSSSEGIVPTFPFVPQAKWSDSSVVVEAKNVSQVGERAKLQSTLTVNRYEVQPDTRYVFSPAPGTLFLNDFKYGLGLGAQLEEQLSLQWGEKLHWVSGAVFGHYDVTPKATVPGGADRNRDLSSQGGAFTYFTEIGNPASAVTVPRVQNLVYQNLGLYTEAAYQPWERLRLTGGARIDVDTRYSGAASGLSFRDRFPVNPRLAAVFSATQDLTLKLIRTQAFVAPPPYFSLVAFDSGSALNIPNSGLRPERATSYELSATWAKRNLTGVLTGYYNRQRSLLIAGESFLPANLVSPEVYLDLEGTQTRGLYRSANSGDSTAVGGELSAKYAWGRASGWGSYSYTHFKSHQNGTTTGLIGASSHQYRLGLTYALLANLSATVSGVMRSRPEGLTVSPDAAGLIRAPYELNAHLLYALSPHFDVFLELRNFTNRRYALSGFAGRLSLQEGIRANAGVRASF